MNEAKIEDVKEKDFVQESKSFPWAHDGASISLFFENYSFKAQP